MTTPSDDSYTIDAHAVASESRGQTPIADAKLVEMLPCPFCGGEAGLWRAHHQRPAWVACMGRCAVLVSREHETDADAIAAWNRRTPSPDQALRSVSGEVVEPSDAELMALQDECKKMPGGLGMLYSNYAREVLRRYAHPVQGVGATTIFQSLRPYFRPTVSHVEIMEELESALTPGKE